MSNFTVEVLYDEEDDCYAARFTVTRNSPRFGDSPEEALKALEREWPKQFKDAKIVRLDLERDRQEDGD